MLYKPSCGKFKDNCVVWHNGRFYLFSMYQKDEGDYRNIWLAESTDGVHWADVGLVVEDSDFLVWAMCIHQVGDCFYLNHGSFDKDGAQNVLKFWRSSDLYKWEYCGEGSDISLDGLSLPVGARLDAMNVLHTSEGFFGYATGPAGFLESGDGLHWRFTDTRIEFGEIPPPPTPSAEGIFEVGGCGEMDGGYYYLGGWFNYMGRKGYGVYTLRADSPRGPFKPDAKAYRLSGNSVRWVSLWARFCKTDSETLVTSYMQQGYSYECGSTWMPPLKKAVVDETGHLRLAYWPGNDVLAGREVDLVGERWMRFRLSAAETFANRDADADRSMQNVEIRANEYPSLAFGPVDVSLALLTAPLDADTGFVVSGAITAASIDKRLVSPSFGIILEECDGFGTAIWLHGYQLTEIGHMSWANGYDFVCEDTIDGGCAAPAGITPGTPHRFILLVRKNMFEFYLDGLLVQTYNTTHFPDKEGLPPARIGFAAVNGACSIDGLKICHMNL